MPAEEGPTAVAVLVTGVYGSGKSSLAMELADLLGDAHAPYALLDLDFLMWFNTGGDSGSTVHDVMLTNLDAVAANYLRMGVRYFILALAVGSRRELESLQAVLRNTSSSRPVGRPAGRDRETTQVRHDHRAAATTCVWRASGSRGWHRGQDGVQ